MRVRKGERSRGDEPWMPVPSCGPRMTCSVGPSARPPRQSLNRGARGNTQSWGKWMCGARVGVLLSERVPTASAPLHGPACALIVTGSGPCSRPGRALFPTSRGASLRPSHVSGGSPAGNQVNTSPRPALSPKTGARDCMQPARVA